MSLTSGHLTARLLSIGHSNNVCHSFADATRAKAITGNLLFHQLMWYISAGCAAWACVVGLGLASSHIFRYRESHAQRQLIRILWTPPVYGIFSFLAVYSYHISDYMTPIADFYEMFALVALYFLFLWHLSHTTNLEEQIRLVTGMKPDYSYDMFCRTYYLVLQVLPVRIITTIVAFVVTATTCLGDDSYKHGHTAINVINGISAGLAVVPLLRFLLRFKAELKQADPRIMLKVICFKAIIIIQAVQNIVLSILTSTNILKPSSTMSYADLNLGLKSFLTAIEVAVICVPLLFAFWPKEFSEKRYLAANQGGNSGSSSEEDGKFYNNGQVVNASGKALAPRKISFIRAIVDSIDMLDIIQGMGRAVKLLRGG